MRSKIVPLAIGLCLLFIMTLPAAAQQSWTGAAADGGNWNGAANWSPSGIPDATTDLFFNDSGAAVPAITIQGLPANARSLTFTSGTVNYSLTAASSPLTLSGVIAITRGSGSGGAAPTINLPSSTIGSLLFPTGSSLTITNNAPATAAGSPTLVIGPNTTIGTPGAGGVIVTGPGTTTFSGSFSNTGNLVNSGLTKTGTGTLTLSGIDAGLSGTVAISGGGTLRLDYTTSATGSKLGHGTSASAGSLALSGGNLALQANATTAILEAVAGNAGTVINPGHSNILMSTNNGGLAPITLDLKQITRPAPGGTLDVDISQTGTTVSTLKNLDTGILGGWFTVNGGATWAAKSGGVSNNITPLATFGVNSYVINTNTDVTTNATVASASINSLRFNSAGSPIVTLGGPLLIQSGGILATPSGTGGTITGGSITTGSPFELTVHAYKAVTINSTLQVTGGLTKTGPQTLFLGGSLASFSGPINVNQGSLSFTINAALPPNLSSINLNDLTGTQQNLTFDLTDNVGVTTLLPIRLGANNTFVNQTLGSIINFIGPITSPPGVNAPLSLVSSDNASGYNFRNSNNSFSGDITLNGGFLGIHENSTLGDPANRLLLNSGTIGGGLEFDLSSVDMNRAVTLLGSSRITVFFSDTISGPVSGAASLFKEGVGTLILSGTNSYSGSIVIDAGTLSVSSLANLGNSANITIKSGATLAVTGTFTLPASRSVPVAAPTSDGTPTIDVASGQTFTIAGAVPNNGGNGALLKTGAGTLALTGTTNAYASGTTVNQGTLQASADGSLGLAGTPVTVNTFGKLTYTNTTTTARPFTLNGGTLAVAATKTLTLNGATVAGGFLSGPGSFNLAGNTTLAAVTATSSTNINQSGAASITNFTNNGTFMSTAGQTLAWQNGSNTTAGRLLVNGTINTNDFVSDGQINIGSGGVLDNSTSASSLFLGGSRTTIDSGGSLKAGSTSIEVNGGLIVNNGTITGTTNVHFNGQAVGAGTFGTVNVTENGRFAPGASASPAVFSPAVVAAAQASFAVNTALAVEIGGNNPGSGYDRLSVNGSAALGGTLEITDSNNFIPGPLAQFQILTASSRTGVFTHYSGITAPNGLAYAPRYSANDLTLIATLFGDANFDGEVGFADLVSLAQNYGTTVADTTDNWWMHGDFNLDGVVDFADLVKIAQNYGGVLPAGASPELAHDFELARAEAPEPSSLATLTALIAAGLVRRRR